MTARASREPDGAAGDGARGGDPAGGDAAGGDAAVRAWRIEPFDRFLRRLPRPTGPAPVVVAVDGRGGAGKSALAERLRAAVPGCAVVATDDVAWHLSFFDWIEPLVSGVLEPARRGLPVRYRPAAWRTRGRPGAVEVPAGCRMVVLEGSGSGRRNLAPWRDLLVWVDADRRQAERRLLRRDGAGPAAAGLREEWAAHEERFFATEAPWERADVVVAGTPTVPLDHTQIELGQVDRALQFRQDRSDGQGVDWSTAGHLAPDP